MTDDLDSADPVPDDHDVKSNEKSRRGRFKDVLDRTRHKITEKVREEKEARKWSLHMTKGQQDGPFDADVAEFLAAGRMNTSSSTQNSVFSDTASENGSPYDQSTPPRTSTSDSRMQNSPKRVHVPRIDVSASQRFPNAKQVSMSPAELPGSLTPGRGGSLLKPEYKSRSQSASCIANPARKARLRGLSVGFIDAPPIIIGEGGDEAEAPPVEISRAKTRRAKSASPQGRNQQHDLVVGRRQLPGGGEAGQSPDVFNPKPLSRAQTGTLSNNTGVVPDTGYDAFVPKPFKRTQTGAMDVKNSTVAQFAPQLPHQRQPVVPPDLGKSQRVTNDRTAELELSLGLTPTSPAGHAMHENQQPRIFAPKPQRAPPSYDLIESGGREDGPEKRGFLPAQAAYVQDIASPRQYPQQQSISQPPSLPVQTRSHERLPQQAMQTSHHHQVPQPMPPPEHRRQVPQYSVVQNHHQQTAVFHELHTPQEDLAPEKPLGLVGRQEQEADRVVVSQPDRQGSQMQSTQNSIAQNRQQHQYRLPDQNLSQRLELAAEQTSPPEAQEQTGSMFPEFENFLRSAALQDHDSPPKSTTISRFASLHSPSVRSKPRSPRQYVIPENEPSRFMKQPSDSSSKPLPPIQTEHELSAYRTTPQSSSSSPHATKVVDLSASSSGRQTLRRVPPLETFHSSPSTYSSSVASPQSGVESGSGSGSAANRLRFYESVNKGIPPAGYI